MQSINRICNCKNIFKDADWRHRLRGVIQMAESMRSSENLAKVQPCLASLLRSLLSSERNNEVAREKHQLVMNLISRLPLDNLEDRTAQILNGLCRQGGAGANRVCKALMQRLPPASIVLKLLSSDFMHAKSSRFREHALQMVMYALMTFPSTAFDMETCVKSAVNAAWNRKRRVRQAALDVLAILGQIGSPRTVLDVAEAAVQHREDGDRLLVAIRTRINRKQIPLMTSEGLVQYTIRIPSPGSSTENDIDESGPLGADIDWINAGVGSVTPSSMQRRANRSRSCANASFKCLTEDTNKDSGGDKSNISGDQCQNQERNFKPGKDIFGVVNNDYHLRNMQQLLSNSNPMSFGASLKRSNADFAPSTNRRLTAKSCSDTSMDGRSSDSTHTSTSSSGNNVGLATIVLNPPNGISGRFTRQTINSRFPSMDRLDVRQMRIHKPPAHQPGMGAYAHLHQQQLNMNSTYTKQSSSLLPMQPILRQKPQTKQLLRPKLAQSTEDTLIRCKGGLNITNNNNNSNLDGTYTICNGIGTALGNNNANGAINERRFINVEKFKINKLHATDNVASTGQAADTTKQSPISAQSLEFSQKSTNSMQSTNSKVQLDGIEQPDGLRNGNRFEPDTTDLTPFDTKSGKDVEINNKDSLNRWVTGEDVLQNDQLTPETSVAHSVEEELDIQDIDRISLQRNESFLSLQSKAESIKTVSGEATPAISRSQSIKSLLIEEEIDGHGHKNDDENNNSNSNGNGNGNDNDADNDHESSFMVVEEVIKQAVEAIVDEIPVSSSSKDSSPQREISRENIMRPRGVIANQESEKSARPRTPTIEEIKLLSRHNSLIKSMESLYERVPTKSDSSPDNTTETSSQDSTQLVRVIAVKPQHTSLKQKAKTTHFLKRNRKVSPIKQSVKNQSTEELLQPVEKFERPREALNTTLNQLDSSNWQVNMEALSSLVRLLRHHPENLEAQMHMVCIQLTRTVRNLRSQVARSACKAAGELFANTSARILEQECDDLAGALFHRTADTNRFLRADASKALESMCDHLSLTKTINLLITKGVAHQNGLVRTTVAKLLNRLVERLGVDKIFTISRENRDKIINTGATLLLEGSLETRSYAKSMFKILSDHPHYFRTLLEVIPQRTYRNIEKTLKNIRQ